MKFIEELSESTKFIAMLVLYTGYLTWWASGISTSLNYNRDDIINNRTAILAHEQLDLVTTKETIKLAEQVKDVSTSVTRHERILQETIEQHVKCSAIMEALIKRIERIEDN